MALTYFRVRKKPIEVKAYQVLSSTTIKTLAGDVKAMAGDWIITGVAGEQYLCKPDIFDQTYDIIGKW